MADIIDEKVKEINEANNKAIYDAQTALESKLTKATDARVSEIKAEFMARIDGQEKELARLKALPVIGQEKDLDRPEHKAFDKFLRKGLGALSPDERKALTIADSTHAGVLAPAEYVNQIYHYASVQHPMRTVATVRQTDRYEVQIPVNDAGCVATWVAEGGTKTETTAPTYALTTIIPQKMQILLKATTEWLDDEVFNAEAEIALQAGRALGALEGTAFYSGNGTTTGPEGINTNATVEADHADLTTDNTIAFDDFIKTQYLLEQPYVTNASWLMNRSTLGTCVGLKSATTNTYLLQPNLQAGQPATILGSPVYTWSDITAQADVTPADADVILFYGDFRQGYMIVDRRGMTIQRLNELYAATGYVGFLITARVGGGVIIPPAIQKLKNITT
jgi:HK97 family phage major capsid protein